jgi:hypothetical protein
MRIAKRRIGQWGGVDSNAWAGSTADLHTARPISLDPTLFTGIWHPLTGTYQTGFVPSGTPLAQHATTKKWGPYKGTSDEQQTITISGGPTGGTWTATYNSVTSGAIPFNATATAVQTALQAMSSIGAGNVTVTGGPGPGTPYVVTFAGTLADTNVAQMTATSSLTGGASPAVAVTTGTQGGSDNDANLGVLVGFQYGAVAMDPSTDTVVGSALLERGFVVETLLPFPVDANGWADVGSRFIRR